MPGWPPGYPSKGAWLFENVTQDFTFWPTLDSVSISQLHPDGLSAMACTVVDIAGTLVFENGDEVIVTFDGVRIWAGHIRVPGKGMRSEVGPRAWELVGQDYTARLDDSVINIEAERPRESVADRVDWILSHLAFAVTTAGVDLPSGTVEPWSYEGTTIREALQQVSDEKGMHFYVDYEKDLHVFQTENIAAPFDIDNDSPDYSDTFPVSEFSHSEDDIELTNAVRVKGKRHSRWVTDDDSIAAYGRQESAIVDDSLTTLEQVIAAGRRRLFQLAWPIVEGSFVCWEPGLRAGMTFDLTEPEWGNDGVDGTYIITEVEITAVDPHDDEGEAHLRSAVRYTDRRRVGRYPGSGRDNEDTTTPGSPGTTDPPGSCCNPIPAGPAELIDWASTNIMGFKQGHTSGTSHSFLLPDGSGYPGGTVGGDITDREVLLFLMTADEVPGSGGGLDHLPAPWDHINSEVIACTHGFFPFNDGHPNMQTRVYRLEVDANPGEYAEAGASVVVASSDATEVLWVTVLVGGVDTLTNGPGATDWDLPTWSSGKPTPPVGKRALYLSVAFNRAWDSTGSGLGLNPEDHDTSVVTGTPSVVSGASAFSRIANPVGGEKTIFLDHAFSPVNAGTLPNLDATGYTGTGGSQDFIITRLYGYEVTQDLTGFIKPGPTWEGGNPLVDDSGAETTPFTVTDGVVTITNDETGKAWAWVAAGPPDLPTSIGDWIISQEFTLSVAGSLTDPGRRYLEIGADFDDKYLAASVRFGDDLHPQGVAIDDAGANTFTAKDIVEGEPHMFQVKWDGTTLYARFWLIADGEPAADVWDVSSTGDFGPALDPEDDGLDRFYYAVRVGNNGGTPMVLTIPSPTIEGGALAGESVDWEVVTMDGATGTTRYPYDELSLHVRVDGQMLGGTAIEDMDGDAGTFTLVDEPYEDPADPTGGSVVEARYTRI